MNRHFRLIESQRGATAIEYAIIAGLIGLGLVGSLVTTRGSLSGTFGKAGSQMASASVETASQPVQLSPSASYWQAKTLKQPVTSTTSGSVTAYSYYYTDGSFVSYQETRDNGGAIQFRNISVFDTTRTGASSNDTARNGLRLTADGQQVYFQVVTYDVPNYGDINRTASTYGGSETQTTNRPFTSTTSGATVAFMALNQKALDDMAYFSVLPK